MDTPVFAPRGNQNSFWRHPGTWHGEYVFIFFRPPGTLFPKAVKLRSNSVCRSSGKTPFFPCGLLQQIRIRTVYRNTKFPAQQLLGCLRHNVISLAGQNIHDRLRSDNLG
jgi:hypothetical protein